MRQDSVIVYRSRMEKFTDEFWYNNMDLAFYLLVGVIGFLAVVWLYTTVRDSNWYRRLKRRY